MLNIKSSHIVLIGIMLFLSCKEDEDVMYSTEPMISGLKVEHRLAATSTLPNADSIQISFDVTDGDFDLGLNSNLEESNLPPYHPANYFIIAEGALVKVAPTNFVDYYDKFNNVRRVPLIEVESPATLATFRTLISELQDSIPYGCANFLSGQQLAMSKNVLGIQGILDTVQSNIVIQDTVLFELNMNHFNLLVDFLYEENGTFKKFDFWNQACTTFNGRFPILGSKTHIKNGPFNFISDVNRSGRLTYTLRSNLGFRRIFGSKKIKIQVSIKDRALNTSNTLESEELIMSE